MTRFASRDLMFAAIPSETDLGSNGTQECATKCTCCTNKTAAKKEGEASDRDLVALERQLAAIS